MGVTFLPPTLDAEIEREARAFSAACLGDTPYDEDFIDFLSRSFDPDTAEELRCQRVKGCVELTECVATEPPPGTVGSAICNKQAACSAPCEGWFAEYVDANEPYFRPALAAELWRCANETDCQIATACWNALMPSAGLAAWAHTED
jgi:hypothetical protein